MKTRLLWAAGIAYATLSVIETVAGAGAALIVFGEIVHWWDLL